MRPLRLLRAGHDPAPLPIVVLPWLMVLVLQACSGDGQEEPAGGPDAGLASEAGGVTGDAGTPEPTDTASGRDASVEDVPSRPPPNDASRPVPPDNGPDPPGADASTTEDAASPGADTAHGDAGGIDDISAHPEDAASPPPDTSADEDSVDDTGARLDVDVEPAPVDAAPVEPDAMEPDTAVPDTSVPEPTRDRVFGQACERTEDCVDGLLCLPRAGTSRGGGYCTRPCSRLDTACSGAPQRSHAECALELESGSTVCAFVCLLDHGDHFHSYDCPSIDGARMRCLAGRGERGHRYCETR